MFSRKPGSGMRKPAGKGHQGRENAYRASDDEDPFLFPSHPLHDLVRALRKGVTARVWACYAIKFEHWGRPGEGYSGGTDAMLDLDVRVLRVKGCVKRVV